MKTNRIAKMVVISVLVLAISGGMSFGAINQNYGASTNAWLNARGATSTNTLNGFIGNSQSAANGVSQSAGQDYQANLLGNVMSGRHGVATLGIGLCNAQNQSVTSGISQSQANTVKMVTNTLKNGSSSGSVNQQTWQNAATGSKTATNCSTVQAAIDSSTGGACTNGSGSASGTFSYVGSGSQNVTGLGGMSNHGCN